MNHSEFGDLNGQAVIYFHGAPGGPGEASIFDEHAKRNNIRLICLDRFSITLGSTPSQYYQTIVDHINHQTNGAQVDLIGFSIGCQCAIEVSALLNEKVRRLYLISAAAPLCGGDFLPTMAARTIFSLALRKPIFFSLLSYSQAVLATLMPRLLFKMLFASAQGEDRKLAKKNQFKNDLTIILSDCFNRNVKGYMREIHLYVRSSQTSVLSCKARTYLWHGADDNWSPPAMADYLQKSMPASLSLNVMPGLSHYSCLKASVPEVCAHLKAELNKESQKFKDIH